MSFRHKTVFHFEKPFHGPAWWETRELTWHSGPVSLSMHTLFECWACQLIVASHLTKKYLLGNHFPIKDNGDLKTLKGHHVTEKVHVFSVTSEKRIPKKQLFNIRWGTLWGDNGHPNTRDVQIKAWGTDCFLCRKCFYRSEDWARWCLHLWHLQV